MNFMAVARHKNNICTRQTIMVCGCERDSPMCSLATSQLDFTKMNFKLCDFIHQIQLYSVKFSMTKELPIIITQQTNILVGGPTEELKIYMY